MNLLIQVLSFLRSRALTVWMIGLFIIYYLTVAVWFKEAFGTFVESLSKNNLFRLVYILFVLNMIFRVTSSLKSAGHRRLKFWFRLPLYLGLILFLVSFFLSVNLRQTRWLVRGEGDPVEIPWEDREYQVALVKPALKERSVRTESSRIFDYEPGIILKTQTGSEYSISAFPPTVVGSTYMHILNFGIGPGVELKKKQETLVKGYIPLRLTPFGSVDSFQLKPFPYTFYLSIIPNRVFSKGRDSALAYDLKQPLYRVEVARGDRMIAKGDTDSLLTFEEDMTLSFFTPSDWVLLEVVHDPLYPWYVASLVLLVAGVFLYIISTTWMSNKASNS